MSDNIIQLNQELIHNELKDLVRNSVEETLNALLDHEAEQLVNAEKYERSGERKGYRSGHYNRNFQTTSGDVTLNACGISLDYIRESLGHSNLNTTLGYIYNPLTTEETQKLLEKAL